MGQVAKRLDGVLQDAAFRFAVDVGHEAHPAGIMFELRVAIR